MYTRHKKATYVLCLWFVMSKVCLSVVLQLDVLVMYAL